MSVVSSSFPLGEACPAPPFWLPLPVAGLVPPFAALLESPGVSSGESSVPASMVDPPEAGRAPIAPAASSEGETRKGRMSRAAARRATRPRVGAVVFAGVDACGEGECAGE